MRRQDSSNRLGRFLTPDPMAGSVGNPQSVNRYAYVGNDPVNLVDPLGLSHRQIQTFAHPDPGQRGHFLHLLSIYGVNALDFPGYGSFSGLVAELEHIVSSFGRTSSLDGINVVTITFRLDGSGGGERDPKGLVLNLVSVCGRDDNKGIFYELQYELEHRDGTTAFGVSKYVGEVVTPRSLASQQGHSRQTDQTNFFEDMVGGFAYPSHAEQRLLLFNTTATAVGAQVPVTMKGREYPFNTFTKKSPGGALLLNGLPVTEQAPCDARK